MKTAKDPRHIRRERALRSLFQFTYTPYKGQSELAHAVIKNHEHVDQIITQAAPEWPLEKLNRVDISILRLAVYELLLKQTPPKVVIDEAVELAKQYGADNSPRFINGALGTALNIIEKDIKLSEKITPPEALSANPSTN